MPTSPSSLVGLSYPAAIQLAAEIDGSPNADNLCMVGFPYPLAIELAAQATAGTGDVNKLVALGMSNELANAVKAAIDA